MMAAILNQLLKERGVRAEVESAGTLSVLRVQVWPVSPMAVAAVAESGSDISGHRSRHISQIDPGDYDVIFCANRRVMRHLFCRGFGNTQLVNTPWGLRDPEKMGVHRYLRCAEVIKNSFREIVQVL